MPTTSTGSADEFMSLIEAPGATRTSPTVAATPTARGASWKRYHQPAGRPGGLGHGDQHAGRDRARAGAAHARGVRAALQVAVRAQPGCRLLLRPRRVRSSAPTRHARTVSGYAVDSCWARRSWRSSCPTTSSGRSSTSTPATRGEARDYEIAIQHREGRRVDLHVTNMPVIVDGAIVGVFGVAKDITERQALEKQLTHHAFHDTLTGLPNRALFMDRLVTRAGAPRPGPRVAGGAVHRPRPLQDHQRQPGPRVRRRPPRGRHGAGAPLSARRATRWPATRGDEFTILAEALEGKRDAVALAERIVARLARALQDRAATRSS